VSFARKSRFFEKPQIDRGRVLSFDVPAALAAGEISVAREKEGRPVEVRDVMIAGIARSRRATVATRNIGHFDGSCPVVDPWAGA